MALQSQDIEENRGIQLKDYRPLWQRAGEFLVQKWDTTLHHPDLNGEPDRM